MASEYIVFRLLHYTSVEIQKKKTFRKGGVSSKNVKKRQYFIIFFSLQMVIYSLNCVIQRQIYGKLRLDFLKLKNLLILCVRDPASVIHQPFSRTFVLSFLQDSAVFECNTTSDWLNHYGLANQKVCYIQIQLNIENLKNKSKNVLKNSW